MTEVHFENIKDQIIKKISNSKLSIKIAIAWFTNEELFSPLLVKLAEGLSVELIVVNDSINNRITGLNFNEFIERGGDFYFANSSHLMHNKFSIFDDALVINGSYNWTYNAEFRNKENITILEGEEVLTPFLNEFDALKVYSTYQKDRITLKPQLNKIFKEKEYLVADLTEKIIVEKQKGQLRKALTTSKIALDISDNDAHVKKLNQEINQKLEEEESIKFYTYRNFDKTDRVIIKSDISSGQLGVIEYFRRNSKGIKFYIRRDNYKGLIGIFYDESNIIHEKPKPEKYYYHIEDGQFTREIELLDLLGNEGDIIKFKIDEDFEIEAYILFIEDHYVECIGDTERSFPKNKVEHDDLKKRMKLMNGL